MDIILGLDISSKSTGYAVLKNGRWTKAKNSFGTIKIPEGLGLGERLTVFKEALVEVLERVKPSSIIIEETFAGRNMSTLKLLSRFSGVAIESCFSFLKVEPQVILASSVRSFLGCGKSKKEAFDYINKKYSLKWSFEKYNDITDALCLALYLHKNKKGK